MTDRKDLPRLSQIMARDITVFAPQDEIVRAMTILIERHLSGAPVLDEAGRIVGMLSKKDCLRAALNASYYQQWGGRVDDYMAREVETLDPDLDILEAARKFLASPYRRFPVARDGVLLGQVSRIDLLRALAAQWR